MDSKIIERIISQKDEISNVETNNSDLYEMINLITSSEQYYIFDEIMSDVKEKYFIKDNVHGISHNERVAIIAMALAIKEGIEDEDLRVVLKSALYHDIGRTEGKGKDHGRASAQILDANKDELAPDLDDFDLDIVKFLCTIHSNPDSEFETIAKEYDLSESPELRKMVNILKDADALDRVRLQRFGKLDVNLLRTDAAKEMVEIAKSLYREYLDIQYDLGITFDTSAFDISMSNALEDEENYYIFRTLNEDNLADLNNPDLPVIRTKAQVAKDNGLPVRFETDSTISLEEIYSNIRVARTGKTTNCISFSSNANVSLDYDNDSYVMYAIPKTGNTSTYIAGKYMLEEINKRISQKLRTTKIDSNIIDIISQIDAETDVENIKVLVGESLANLHVRQDKKRYTGSIDKIASRESLLGRFEKKQFFNERQELEYRKIVAKLTILEVNGILRSILPTQINNSNLLSTLGGAFSSSEFIQYGSIPKEQLISVSKNDIELLAILQQASKIEGIDSNTLNLLRNRILGSIKSQTPLTRVEPINFNSNPVNLSPENIIEYLSSNESNQRIIPYHKGSIALEYIQNYARAKMQTYALVDRVREELFPNDNSQSTERFFNAIIRNTIIPNGSIVSRRNNSGVQLAESVNLDMNPQNGYVLFSKQEQQNLVTALNSLSKQQLKQISEGDLSALKSTQILTQNITSKEYAKDSNEYYIDYILDGINLEEIYRVSNVRTEKREELRHKLAEGLNKVDISKLYRAIISAGVDYKQAPNYIVNLFLEDGYGKKESFEELVNSDDLETIISQNINNLNNRITSYSIDKFLGIQDNNNLVEGSSIVLRDYQQQALDGVETIFENRNFAGVVLPTGAGKSFVSMAQMLKAPKQNMMYFAPQIEILNQVQKHILKNIVGKTILTREDIDLMIDMSKNERRAFLANKVYNPSINIEQELAHLKQVPTNEDKEEIRNKILPRRTDTYDDVMDAIHTVFPHLDMYCYQSLNGSKYDEMLKKNADLIIFDELHRTGAATWKPLIKELVRNQPNSKILGITATPVRDDTEHTDMMQYMAENYGGYTSEELLRKEYLAEEMYLIDAMQNKYVVEPKIVSFDFSLRETEEYEYVVETLAAERSKNPNSEVVRTLEQIQAQMDEIIDNGAESLKNNVAGIASVLEKNIPENLRNGKFIVFLEQRPSDSEAQNTEEYVKQQIELVNKYFSGVNGDVNSGYLLSEREVKSENAQAIQNFETLSNDQLKLLYAINMLNEGVHVDNINGELMLRRIGSGSNILYFQQIGRVIYGIDPNNPPSEENVPIIFDVFNNYLTRDLDKVANMTTPTSDLNNMQMITNWIRKHECFPDINSEIHDEARKAIALKKIQEKYEKYLDGIRNSNLSATEVREIERILELAKEINLFEEEIPDRIIPPGEKELGRVQAFEVKGNIKKFSELFKEAKRATRKVDLDNREPSPRLRIKTTMTVLQILSEYGVELSDESFINAYQKQNPNRNSVSAQSTSVKKNNAKQNLSLLSFIDNNFSENTRKRIFAELDMDIEELADFKIYDEFDYARTVFLNEIENSRDGREKRTKKTARKQFELYDIKDIRKTGILKRDGQYIRCINSSGFVLESGPEIFRKTNIFTGTNYDEEGYDINGYDIDGYDREGYNDKEKDRDGFKRDSKTNDYSFTRDGINVKTNTPFDEHGFDFYGIYWAPNPEFPDDFSKRINTHKIVNEYGFNRDGHWYREDENGNLVYVGLEDDLGFKAFEEISKYNFRRDGINIQTNSIYDSHGFAISGIHKDTSTQYDSYGFRIDGCYENTKYIQTNPRGFNIDHFYKGQPYIFFDNNGYDIDGWDINGYDEGILTASPEDRAKHMHFTQPVDERGFNQKRIHMVTQTIYDENFLTYDRKECKIVNGQIVVLDSPRCF